MNIEIANRLCAYRKHHGLSQEDLAEKIGVSRQAVSKWERAEASPDTDNLILLSKIYDVTLDDLLYKDPEGSAPEDAPEVEKTRISFKHGIHVESGNESVHIDHTGIHVDDPEDSLDIDWSGIHKTPKRSCTIVVDDDGTSHYYDDDGDEMDEEDVFEASPRWYRVWKKIPWTILCCITYLLLGFLVPGGWGCGWLVFLTIPLYGSLGKAILYRRPNRFAYAVLATLVYLSIGMLRSIWHPTWLIFLTIPVYYSIFKKK